MNEGPGIGVLYAGDIGLCGDKEGAEGAVARVSRNTRVWNKGKTTTLWHPREIQLSVVMSADFAHTLRPSSPASGVIHSRRCTRNAFPYPSLEVPLTGQAQTPSRAGERAVHLDYALGIVDPVVTFLDNQ